MSVVAVALRELIALGVSGDALIAAVERIEAAAVVERASTVREAVEISTMRADAALAARKTKAAERTRKWRENKDASVTVTSGDVTSDHGDACDDANPLPLPPFPQTPKPPTPTPGSVFTRVREDGDFDLFWAVYPKRIGKADARKAFSKALKATDLQTILCAVERQREWEQWQRGFAPHPATWLNGQRWSDEEPATPATPPRAPHERPHHDAKFEARQANLSRAFAGADRAAGRDWKP